MLRAAEERVNSTGWCMIAEPLVNRLPGMLLTVGLGVCSGGFYLAAEIDLVSFQPLPHLEVALNFSMWSQVQKLSPGR
jgi:hypothetical protein